jgi:hypothetical protein
MKKQIEGLNKDILALWDSVPITNRGKLIPLLYSHHALSSGGMVFVGFNPSFNDRVVGNFNFKRFLYRGASNVDYGWLHNFEKNAFDHYPYFTKIKELAVDSGMAVSVLDLFLVRGKNQLDVCSSVLDSRGMLNNFGAAQFAIFKRVLNLCAPKVLVVGNAKASEIIRREMDLVWNESGGYYQFPCCQSDLKFPIHLVSMLSGRRPLDRFSLERLKWHVKHSIRRADS